MTVLGLGPMGRALAGAFLTNGHRTTVWNRTASKADALVAKSAIRAATAAEAVAASDLVIVCVLDQDAVRTIVEQAAESLKGRTLVNLTTGTPEQARAMATWAAERGVDYLDGAIVTPAIGTPAARLFYSGPEDLYEAHRSTLASLGGTHTHLGTDAARAAAYDVSLLDLFWTAATGYLHALALADAQGIAAKDLTVDAQGIVGLVRDLIPVLADQVESRRYPGDGSNLVSAAAGIDHIIDATKASGLDAGVLSAARVAVLRAIEAGHGDDSFARVVEMFGSAQETVSMPSS